MRDLLSVPAMRPPGSPRRRGSWQAPYHEPRGSAPRERDHRGGDHPVPSRTRQLSPPSPRVLQREAAGGQGVALAEGAFLMRMRRVRREGPAGDSPCGPLRVLRRSWLRVRADRRCGAYGPRPASWGGQVPQGGIVPCGPLRVLGHCPAGRSDEGVFPRPGGSADGGACATSADRGAGGPPGGASLPGGPSFGRCAPARFCAVCAPCRRLQVFYSCLCAIGWSEAGFLSLCAASRFGLLLVAESVYEDYNLKAMYSSLAQCRCRGLYEPLISACTFGTYKV